ncbi:glycosyltransferase family 4 protein [Brevundimonas sp. NIBR11]|uniref:glycosyltransferase family 4 protein n=1 Tax=Brevundimonas sp. NIBR11 TaxID=3015999 RepID=UPI0022F046B3|nr:glycosyltransferase family 4 protein [Brevundimonas sp. NIBR11]WGM31832.1 N-acetyl-alpha-D-glucosaminyl L-malate synthase [Brevundimonas sp. NIBR11]
MRIVIVTHCFKASDGQGRVNAEVARAAALAGHQVHLIADEVAPDLVEAPGITWTRATHGPLPTALLKYAWFWASSGLALRKVRKGADVVVVNGSVTAGRSDLNAVHFVHGGWRASRHYRTAGGLKGLYQTLLGRLNIISERRAFDRSRLLTAVSPAVAEEIRRVRPSASIEIIPNGVDCQEFHPRDAGEVRPKEAVILFAGDIRTSRKNLDTVLQALTRLPGARLHVAGDTTGSPYPEMARSLGLQDRVRFLGQRGDMADVMRDADLFVFPSRYEPFGLVILEALATGLPVVTTVAAGAAELVRDADGVVLQDPDDVEALARETGVLLADAARMARAGLAGRRIAVEHSWDRMARRYIDAFERLAPTTSTAS